MRIVLLIVTCFLLSCNASKYSITKIANQTNTIRLDGCYYDTDKLIPGVCIYFFYSNGVFYNENTYYEDLEKGLHLFKDRYDKRIYSNYKADWGLYKIIGNNIIMEKPEPIHGFPIHKLTGIILNDTTFIITSYEEKKVVTKIKDVSSSHFKQYDYKPDSTNNFFK